MSPTPTRSPTPRQHEAESRNLEFEQVKMVIQKLNSMQPPATGLRDGMDEVAKRALTALK